MNSDSSENVRKRAAIPVEECGMAMAANILGERWALLVLREMFYGVRCFEDIRLDLGIPPATLKKRLSELVDADVIEQFSYQEPGARSRTAYQLTRAGQELALTFLALRQWGDRWLRINEPLTDLVHAQTGAELVVGLVDETGVGVPLRDSSLRPKAKT